ncbi:MAG: macro domain-containing protein [bacterium]|nr:macro domain-containing protein [bacterium]
MEKIEIVLGDITQQSVEAIINAANDRLLAGGGVCGAIHKAAGPELARACNKVGSCSTGHAVITPGYGLKAPYVIHAVGPIWHGGTNNESELLKECYQSIFQIVEEKGLKSVALPAISIGIYGYPKQEATHIALQEAIAFSQKNPSVKVVFVCFDDATLQMYEEQFKQIKKSV